PHIASLLPHSVAHPPLPSFPTRRSSDLNLPTQSALPSLIGTPYQIATGLTYPGFTQMTMSENEANSHYNALQVDLNSQIKDLQLDRKSTRLNSSHVSISYAVFCLKKKKK